MPTLKDILEELSRPGRDPRKSFEAFSFGDVEKIEDLKPGMKLPGIVTNVTAFGAFVEILPGQDGLLHISELDTKRVERVEDVLNLGDEVRVKITGIDADGRIKLSRKACFAPKRK